MEEEGLGLALGRAVPLALASFFLLLRRCMSIKALATVGR